MVRGVKVSLARFGKGPSLAKKDTPKPAQLVFHAAFVDAVRGDPARTFEKFATLSGTLELKGAARTPTFVGNGEPIEYDAPPADEAEAALRRKLRLEFESSQFDEMLDPDEDNRRLVLPEEPEDARFVELDTELLVGGAAEASLGTSDLLDVPLGPNGLQVRLFDGNGNVLANARFEARLDGELVSEGLSDGDGIAVIDDLRGASEFDLAWSATDAEPLHYRRKMRVPAREGDTSVHLENLGYDSDEEEVDRVRQVQREFGLPETGLANDVAKLLRDWHNDGQIVVPEGEDDEKAPDSGFTEADLDEGVS